MRLNRTEDGLKNNTRPARRKLVLKKKSSQQPVPKGKLEAFDIPISDLILWPREYIEPFFGLGVLHRAYHKPTLRVLIFQHRF
jgi:hypothetical protein